MDFIRIKDYSTREKFSVRVESLKYRSIFIFKQKQNFFLKIFMVLDFFSWIILHIMSYIFHNISWIVHLQERELCQVIDKVQGKTFESYKGAGI